MLELLFYSLIGGLFSLIGGVILLWQKNFVKRTIMPLLSFAAGAFLATTFLDILPEALEMTQDIKGVLTALLVGFTAFFTLERLLMRFVHVHPDIDSHSHADHTESLTPLLIIGDTLHNFLDGVLIGLTYLVNPSLSMVTTIAIAAHEIPQEIGDFSVLINQGWSRSRILTVNALSSLTTVIGAFLAFSSGVILEPIMPYLLGAVAGIFVYLAASDLIPEVHHKAGHKHFYQIISLFIIGILVVRYFTSLAH
jgi:zinc and cadmium transporter